jgi:hypothetical protein
VKVIYNQMDARWKDHVLGWGPKLGTVGAFGCFNTVLAMVVEACGLHYFPSTLDVLFTKLKIFTKDPTGTFDWLPSDALDRAFPGQFKSIRYPGFRGDLVVAARKTKDTFVAVQVAGYSPLWGMNIATHFVLMAGAGPTIYDPEGGVVRLLAAYGGPAMVQETIVIKHLAAAKPAAPPAATPPKPPVVVVVPPVVDPPAQHPLPPCPIPLPTPPPAEPPPVNVWLVILQQLLALLRRR